MLCAYYLSAQPLYSDVMEKRECLLAPVYERFYSGPIFPSYLPYQKLPNSFILNPGIRYTIQNLSKEVFYDNETNKAVLALLNYAENARLKYSVEYLKKYTKQFIPVQDAALQTLQQYILQDSLSYISDIGEKNLEGEEYLNTDLQNLLKYIQNDSIYMWLRHASRDSITLSLTSILGDSISLWLNNGKMRFYRLWAGNGTGDTIGTWIQVMPKGYQLKLYLDEDVFRSHSLERIKTKTEMPLNNRINSNYLQIAPMKIMSLKRRYWTYYSEVELAMSQGALSNWANGGENSLSLLSNLRYYWNYNCDKTSWENWLHYRFGFMKNGEDELRKNEDRFEINSKVGQQAFKHWYYTAQFNMLTQLFNSYEYPEDAERKLVANFMSPGDFTLSLGMDYKPNDRFSLMISPIAGKWTFVRDTVNIDKSRYSITEAGKRFKREAGAQLNLNSKLLNLFQILDINNELKVFMSYEKKDRYINKDQENEEKKRIPFVANWKLTFNFKINYFMAASLYTETVYDESYSRKLQIKENLNLSVKFRF